MSFSVLNKTFIAISMTFMLAFANNLHADDKVRGVNFLQTSVVAFANEMTDESLRRLVNTGINTVAIVTFVEQDTSAAEEINQSAAVTDDQLIAAIRKAKAHGLQVILKPQVLVKDGWAGLINPGQGAAWKKWFSSYGAALRNYAEIAKRERAEALVIGTELSLAGSRSEWPALIGSIRAIYPGKLTYAAHGIEGVENFKFWELLDYVAVTLYPSMGKVVDKIEMQRIAANALEKLNESATSYHKPVLIAEVGVASYREAQNTPWQVPPTCAESDVIMQANLISVWLEAIRGKRWIAGLLIWNWFSDPYEGGRSNTDFTIQNKPAESIVKCEWTGNCQPAF